MIHGAVPSEALGISAIASRKELAPEAASPEMLNGKHHQIFTRFAGYKLQPSNFFSGFLATVPGRVSFASLGLENGFGGMPIYANVRYMLHAHNIISRHRTVVIEYKNMYNNNALTN